MRVAKYIRVSTNLQDFRRQEDGLNEYVERNKDWEFYASFDDMMTGKHDQRDGFQRMMKSARSHRFQVLVVWDLDRLGRSLVDLIHNCNELMKLKIQIHFINANMILNNSPETQFTFHILGAAAQFERNMISRRVKEGMDAAKKRGKKFGPPLKLGKRKQNEFRQMWNDGVSAKTMMNHFKISKSTIMRYRRSLNLEARGEDNSKKMTVRPEWTKVALSNKSKYVHLNGLEGSITLSQKEADRYWKKHQKN
jgi:DNA invertase Pin-like site-specific DNA recombinase